MAVTSSCLCKKAEGAVPPVVPFIVAVEGRIDDALDALDVDEADHGPGAAAHLHEAAFDDALRPQLAPEVLWEVEEGSAPRAGQDAMQRLQANEPGIKSWLRIRFFRTGSGRT